MLLKQLLNLSCAPTGEIKPRPQDRQFRRLISPARHLEAFDVEAQISVSQRFRGKLSPTPKVCRLATGLLFAFPDGTASGQFAGRIFRVILSSEPTHPKDASMWVTVASPGVKKRDAAFERRSKLLRSGKAAPGIGSGYS